MGQLASKADLADVRADLATVRAEVMARIDRLQDALTAHASPTR